MIYLCFVFVSLIRAEQPLTVCSSQHPFKTKENYCANFLEICVKKGDLDCDAFQGACQQCPSSNLSILAYSEIANMKNHMKQQIQNIINLTNDLKFDVKNIPNETIFFKNTIDCHEKVRVIFSITVTEVLLIFVLTILLVIELRLKIITKKYEINKICKRQRRDKYEILPTYVPKNEKDFERRSKIEKKFSDIDSQLNTILKQLQKPNNKVIREITCRIIGFYEQVKVDVFNKDSVVRIKKRICNKWSDAKNHSFKIMTLKLNNKVIDNNQFLLSLISPEDDVLDCEIDEEIDPETIVILQIKGNVDVPYLIQINRKETIRELKQIIYKFTDSRDIAILKGFEELKNKCTIEYYKLKDDDVVTAVKKESGKIVIRSVLEEDESIVVEYSNTNSIYSIKIKIANKFKCVSENIFLFLNNECLDEDKFIYEYKINNESVIKYYYLMKLKDIKLGESIDKGYYSEIVKGRNESTKTDLLLMKFDLRVSDLKLDGEIIKTLIRDQMQNYHRLCLQHHGIYSNKNFLYVAFENMEGGTLKKYLENHPNTSDDQIRIWSKQILEYLQFIHSHGIIYIDLKPYDIFVDANGDLKIHGLTLNKYFYKNDRKEKIREMLQNKNLQLAYLAPEVRKDEYYDESADIWSFGVIIIRIATGKCPEIGESDALEYNLQPGRSDLREFIDSCIKVDPKERSKIDTLIQHNFLKEQ